MHARRAPIEAHLAEEMGLDGREVVGEGLAVVRQARDGVRVGRLVRVRW